MNALAPSQVAVIESGIDVFVCHGPPRCPGNIEPMPCPFCIRATSVEQVEAELKKTH